MVKRDNISGQSSQEPDEARLTDIAYHQKFNRWAALFGSALFVFFSGFYFYLGNYIQSFIFFLLFANALIAVFWASRIKELKNLIRLKRIASANAFGLLAVHFITGILSKDIYILFPYIFTYPVGVMLMFGKRIGTCWAAAFLALMAVALFAADFPGLDAANQKLIKLNSGFALFILMGIAALSEQARMRIQGDLLEAQNKSRDAEQRQKDINLELGQEVKLRIQSEEALAQSEIHYRTLFDELATSLWEEDWSMVKHFIDKHQSEIKGDFISFFNERREDLDACCQMIRICAVNRATLKLYGALSQKELFENIASIFPEKHLDYFAQQIASLYNTGRYDTQLNAARLDGRPLHLLVSSSVPAGYEKSWAKVYTSIFDNTAIVALEIEKKQVEEKLQFARHIQAVSTLAGGIAHEFNNALAVISGNLELLEIELGENRKIMSNISALSLSADKIGRLTEQLLAYAQGGKYENKPFEVNALISKILADDKLTCLTSVRIVTKFADDLKPTCGDVTQIKMVIESILSNALESIIEKGRVVITTQNRYIHPVNSKTDPNLAQGGYIVISIEDNGTGMDSDICRRIFEPFFTTKLFGRGLGMAAAYGIVKNHNGVITVTSESGQGTLVTVYLPQHIENIYSS